MATIEKDILVRIVNKNDIEANWIKAVNFTPKIGELIIYRAEDSTTELPKNEDGSNAREPIEYPRLKLGDGVTNVNNLPFLTEALWEQIASMNYIAATDDGNGNIVLGVSSMSKAEDGEY